MYLGETPLCLKVSVKLLKELATVMHVAEVLLLAHCRALNNEWPLISFAGTRKLTVLKMGEQLILLTNTLIRERALSYR